MRKILLISPHFDDAVLSAGQLMAGRPNVDVITVFGGAPKPKQKTPYDIKCGFDNSTIANYARKIEDINALKILKANPIHLDFIDGQYRDNELDSFMFEDLEDILLKQIEENNYEFIIAPLGIGHPDHLFVSDVVRTINKKIIETVYLWEDLPLRVIEPELVFDNLTQNPHKELAFLGDGPVELKLKALDCYSSQIGTGILEKNSICVPERFWRI